MKRNKQEDIEARKGWLFMLTGIALVIKIVLSFFGIEIEQAAIDELITGILGIAAAFGVYRNNYFGKVGRAQYKLFKDPEIQAALKNALAVVQEEEKEKDL